MNFVFRKFIFLSLLFSLLPSASHSAAGNSNEKIEAFRSKLLSLPKEDVAYKEGTYPLIEAAPRLGEFPSVIPELYQDALTDLGSGQDSRVFLARSRVDRPSAGLAVGMPLAVRAARIDTSQEKSAAEATLRNFYR